MRAENSRQIGIIRWRYLPGHFKDVTRAILAVLSSFLVAGCADYRYVAVENKYQKAALPLHFDRDHLEDRSAVSSGIRRYRMQRLEFLEPVTMNVDSTGRSYDNPPPGWNSQPVTLDGYHLIENAPYSLDVSYLRELGMFYFGASGGLSFGDLHHYGFFWGASRKFGNLVPGFSMGLYRNWVKTYANYWSKTNSHTDLYGTWTYAGSETATTPRWDVVTRVGTLYDRGRSVSPYVGYCHNQLSLAGVSPLSVHEISLGMMYPLLREYSLSAEISHTLTDVDGHRQDNFGNLQVRMIREL